MSWKQFIFTSNQLKFSMELKVIVIGLFQCWYEMQAMQASAGYGVWSIHWY
jgi:hypothetical protein